MILHPIKIKYPTKHIQIWSLIKSNREVHKILKKFLLAQGFRPCPIYKNCRLVDKFNLDGSPISLTRHPGLSRYLSCLQPKTLDLNHLNTKEAILKTSGSLHHSVTSSAFMISTNISYSSLSPLSLSLFIYFIFYPYEIYTDTWDSIINFFC